MLWKMSGKSRIERFDEIVKIFAADGRDALHDAQAGAVSLLDVR